MNPTSFQIAAPFSTADSVYGAAFGSGLTTMLQTAQGEILIPALAFVTLWIIVQGILVMRGDLDARRGVNRILKVAIVTTIVTSAGTYDDVVQNFFTQTVPSIASDFGSASPLPAGNIPLSLDGILDVCQIEFQAVAAEIGPMNDQDSAAFQGAQFVLYGTLWTMFSIYEIAKIMMDVLVALGPILLIGYLFDATKGIADRWIGQMITYGILLLLVTSVASIVIATEAAYLIVQLAMIALTGPTSAQIISFYEMDMFLLTGDAFVVALPTIAGLLGGGVSLNPGESLGRLGSAGFRRASGAAGGYGAPVAGAPATTSYRGM